MTDGFSIFITGIIIFFIGSVVIFVFEKRNLALLMSPMGVGFIIMVLGMWMLSDEARIDNESFIKYFSTHDCQAKADLILKNHLSGNPIRTELATQEFIKSGCVFDIGTNTLLEPNP